MSTRWRAPGRVNLIGEHTDYNDGFSLPIALQRGTTATLSPRSDGVLALSSAQQPDRDVTVAVASLAPGSVSGWAAYPAGMLWALRRPGAEAGAADLLAGGADIGVDSDVPQGSGLSSSAALECAVAMAVLDDAGLAGADRMAVARVAQRTENEFVGAPTGIMDQAASLACTEGNALLLDARSLAVRQVPFNLATAGLTLLVVQTGAEHSHVESEYGERRRACEMAAKALGLSALRDADESVLCSAGFAALDPVVRRRVRHVVTENARTLRVVELLDAGRITEIGPLLTASHVSLRDDYEVSIGQLDVAVQAALSAGALGARMTGGGFGGCAIALIDAGTRDAVTAAIRRGYADAGYAAPEFFVTTPAAGARRLEQSG